MSNCVSSATREGQSCQIRIGPHTLKSNVLLAPMSGVTDLPFRRIAHVLGASLVTTEMVASEHLVNDRHNTRKRAVGRNLAPFVIQLAGCEARWMAEGARMARQLGADIVDINMGCPAREVTGKLSGSALMRDLDHAAGLIEAAFLASGRDPGPPALAEQGAIAVAHVEDMLAHHGRELGLRHARKHVGWYLASSARPSEAVKAWRRRLCTSEDAGEVLAGLKSFYAEAEELAA